MMTDAPVRSAREERAGLDELYARHLPEARSLAFLLVGDADLAEDLSQEAFVKLAGRFRHLRNPDAFGAYLRRTVVNLCRSHFRRARVERLYLRRHSVPERVVPSPDERSGGELARALRELPHRQRAAIVLRFYEDLSEAQAAEALRCSPKAVNGLVTRAMETLRRQLGNEGE